MYTWHSYDEQMSQYMHDIRTMSICLNENNLQTQYARERPSMFLAYRDIYEAKQELEMDFPFVCW